MKKIEIEVFMMENYSAPRTCKVCKIGMWEGFVFEDGETFCSEKCLYTEVSPEEYQTYYEIGIGYWTEWDEEDMEEDI